MTSVRLTKEQAAELDQLAAFDGVAVAEEIREAIALLLAARRADPEFRERVRQFAERSQRMLEELEQSGQTEPARELSGAAASR